MNAMGWRHDMKRMRGRYALLTLVCVVGMLALAGCSGSSSDTRTQAKASQSGDYQVFAQIATPRNGDFILFHADGTTDATFEAVASGGTDPLSYNWSITGPDYRNTATGETGTITFYTPGEYTFVLTVVDGRGLTDTDSIRVTVGYASDQQLTGPGLQAVITNPSGETFIRLGDSIAYASSVIGGSGTYGYLWQFDGGQPLSATTAGGTVTYNQLGTFTTTLRVTDSFGETATDSVLVRVVSYSREGDMTVQIVSPAASTVPVGVSQTLSYTVTGGSNTYTQNWTVTPPSGTIVTSNAASFSYSFPAAGGYVVRLTVQDSGTGEIVTTQRIFEATN
jgi:hypothetical protein